MGLFTASSCNKPVDEAPSYNTSDEQKAQILGQIVNISNVIPCMITPAKTTFPAILCGLPSTIGVSPQDGYIKALIDTRENNDLSIFRDFMTDIMISNLKYDIDTFISSTEEMEGETDKKVVRKKEKSREKIIAAIKKNGRHTTNSLSELVGVTPKAIEKHLAKLKAEGILVRIGPDKGGHWEITDNSK